MGMTSIDILSMHISLTVMISCVKFYNIESKRVPEKKRIASNICQLISKYTKALKTVKITPVMKIRKGYHF